MLADADILPLFRYWLMMLSDFGLSPSFSLPPFADHAIYFASFADIAAFARIFHATSFCATLCQDAPDMTPLRAEEQISLPAADTIAASLILPFFLPLVFRHKPS
jgi:hypothetical protein